MSSVNFNNNKFQGRINGENANEYYHRAKYINHGSVEEIIEGLNEILGTEIIDGQEFYNDYWTKVFLQSDEEEYQGGIKLVLKTTDSLYSDSNIAMVLELMATNIIRSEKKADNPEKYIKVFHSRELFLKELDEFKKFENVVESTNDGKSAMAQGVNEYFILANQMNYKFEKKWTELDDSHLEKLDEEYGTKYPAVHDYYTSYVQLKRKLKETVEKTDMKKATFEEKRIIKMMTRNVRSLKEDFVECIEKKLRPIVFKAPLPDSGKSDYDLFDETDKKHIKTALRVNRGGDMQDDLSVIIKDLDNTIKECKLTETHKEIIQLLKTDDTIVDIAKKMGINRKTFDTYIDSIVNKISNKNYEKIEDWYYLNISKGVYKKCSKCNEVKLISQFNKEPKGILGTKSKCKLCQFNKNPKIS